MATTIELGDVTIELTRRAVKHVHLAVHPPDGRVTLVVPEGTRLDVARAYAATKLGWIRARQARFREQRRALPRRAMWSGRATTCGGGGISCRSWNATPGRPSCSTIGG